MNVAWTPDRLASQAWRALRDARNELNVKLMLRKQGGKRLLEPTLRRSFVTPEAAQALADCATWLREYLCAPHPQLGRSGEICPYLKTAIRKNRVSFGVYDGITQASPRELAEVFLYEGMALKRALRDDDDDRELNAACVLFPRLAADCFENMKEAHTLIKSLMMRRGIMVSVFYPGYDKPALYNSEFALYQSPFPIAAVRPMAIRDIAFLDRNEEAFTEYRRRYGREFAEGKVSNKFGHVDRFEEAEKRFPR